MTTEPLTDEDLARIEQCWPCSDVRALLAEVKRLRKTASAVDVILSEVAASATIRWAKGQLGQDHAQGVVMGVNAVCDALKVLRGP